MNRMSIPISILTDRFNFGRFTVIPSPPGSASENNPKNNLILTNMGDEQEGRQMPLASRFSNLKPLGEFFDFKRLSKPSNFGEVQSRASYNLGYFASNYAVVFTMLSIYSLLTNLLLLFVILLVVGGMWGIGRLGGRDLTIGRFTFFLASGGQPLEISRFSPAVRSIGSSSHILTGHVSRPCLQTANAN